MTDIPAIDPAARDLLDEIVERARPPINRSRIALPPITAAVVGLLSRARLGRLILAGVLLRRSATGDRDGVAALAEQLIRTRVRHGWGRDGFVERWRRADDPVRADVGRFLAEVGRSAEMPTVAPPDDGELFVVLPGVGRATIEAAIRGASPSARILDLAGVVRLDGSSAVQPLRVDLTSREISEGWFEHAAAAAIATRTILEQMLEGSKIGSRFAAHRDTLTFQLRHEIAYVLRPLEALRRAIAEHRPERVRFVEGAYPSTAFRAEAEAGGVARRCITVIRTDPTAMVSGPPQGPGAADPAAGDDPAGALEAAVERMHGVVCPWSLRDRAVVVADLRNPLDFRHLRSATAILTEAARRRPVVLLHPMSRFNLRMVRVVARLVRRHGVSVRPAFIRNLPAVSRFHGDVVAWRRPLLGAIAHDGDPRDPRAVADRAAVLEATGIVLSGHLPGALAVLGELDRMFGRTPPAYVCAVPAGKLLAVLAIGAARARSVATMEVQTLLVGTSKRDWRPIADRVAVLDDAQAELNVGHFGLPAERMVLVGREGLYEDRRAALGHRRVASERRRVLFVSQPLVGLTASTLEAVLEACARRSDVDLSVVGHPDESAAVAAAHLAAVAASGMAERVRVTRRGISREDLLDADLVITIASNVGMQAAVMERDVLVVNLSGADLPVHLDRSGLALYADTRAAVAERIDALLDDAAIRAELAARRADYLRRNPQFVTAETAVHVVDAVETATRRPAPSRPDGPTYDPDGADRDSGDR